MTSRRQFVQSSTAALTAASYRRVLGANDRVRLGVIGTGGRGQYLMKTAAAHGGVEWVAVCDVYNVRRDQAATIAGGQVRTYNEHERVLKHQDIDAVIIATPDHWHGIITVEACEAGKDVYVEKPLVHYPKDGQAVVAAARAHQRVIAVGTHCRAIPHMVEAREKYVESGIMGKIGLARTYIDSNQGYTFVAPPGMEKKPEGLDWKRWCGPQPQIPWNPEVYFSPYKWLHYDGGMIMGIGIHSVDQAEQFLDVRKPSAALAGGGVYHFKDGRDTPDVVNIILEYPQEVNVTFEAEIMTAGMSGRRAAGIELRGTGGILHVYWYDPDLGYEYAPHPKNSKAPRASAPASKHGAEYLMADWLECLRTRRKPVSNEVTGYYSAIACFMANRAFQTRSRVTWDKQWDLPA